MQTAKRWVTLDSLGSLGVLSQVSRMSSVIYIGKVFI